MRLPKRGVQSGSLEGTVTVSEVLARCRGDGDGWQHGVDAEGRMTNETTKNALPECSPEDDIDWYFGHANPNPTRRACVPHDVLLALARRERPIEDPAYEHLTQCSPCYREFRRLQMASLGRASRT